MIYKNIFFNLQLIFRLLNQSIENEIYAIFYGYKISQNFEVLFNK